MIKPLATVLPPHPLFWEHERIKPLIREAQKLERAYEAYGERTRQAHADAERKLMAWNDAARAAVLAGDPPPPKPVIPDPEPPAVSWESERVTLDQRADNVVRAIAGEILETVQADLARTLAEAEPHRDALRDIAARAQALRDAELVCLAKSGAGRPSGPQPQITAASLV